MAHGVNEISVTGEKDPSFAAGRLGHVHRLIEQRHRELEAAAAEAGEDGPTEAMTRFQGPPFQVYARDLAPLMANNECFEAFKAIAAHGERCGVVLHWSGEMPTSSQLRYSGELMAAFVAGTVFQPLASNAEVRASVEAALLNNDFLSAVADDPEALARVCAAVAGEGARLRIAAAFRLAVDVLDPQV